MHMIARRLTLRERKAPRGVLRLFYAALGVVLVGTVGVLAGLSHPVFVAMAGAGGMALLVSVALRIFPTAMAIWPTATMTSIPTARTPYRSSAISIIATTSSASPAAP